MHRFFVGLMGFFMSFGSVFHDGHTAVSATAHIQDDRQTNASISASVSPEFGDFHGKTEGRRGMQLPQGERPFFGTVTIVNGSTLTMEPELKVWAVSLTPSITSTPSAQQTLIVTLDNSTVYTGGSQRDIVVHTKIAGVGKLNSDGSITAITVRINPVVPHGVFHTVDKDIGNTH